MNKLWAFGIIVLFIGASVIPSMGVTVVEKHISQDNKASFKDFNPRGNTLYVGGSGPNNYTTIQAAIDDASDGDTVFVYDDSSPYFENVVVNKNVTLEGENRYTTVIDGMNIDYKDTIRITSNGDGATIFNFTITNCGTSAFDRGIDLDNVNYVTVKENIVMDNPGGAGIYSGASFGVTISNNVIINNHDGLWMSNSHKHVIVNNTFYNNTQGIWWLFCNDNTIVGNNFTYNKMCGINFYTCCGNNVSFNTIIDNGRKYIPGTEGPAGIYAWVDSYNNVFRRNVIKGNKKQGVKIYGGGNNILIENDIMDNYKEGVKISYSGRHIIYHNNIVNNSKNGIDRRNDTLWNNSYPSGGNYWDDYTGEDDDGDGLGDTPYNISGGGSNKDWYPLIYKWGENPPYANFTYSGNLTVTFDASCSIDRDGTIVMYEWDFGDGNSGSGLVIDHTYPDYGTYTVNLTVTDDDGKTHSGTKTILVIPDYPPDPPPTPSGPTYLLVGESGTFSTYTTDPNGDMIQYRFDWDAKGSHNISNWTDFVPSGETVSLNHTWNISGTYVVKAQARDDNGYSSGWSTGLSVLVNTPPNQPFDPEPENGTTDVDINADLSWSGGDPDPGDTVVYDVYLEANDPMPDVKVADNVSETMFDPGALEYGTTYYWQIIAKDNHGENASGLVWHFSTEPAPVPDLSCDGELSWTDVKPGETVNGSFTVENIGESGSLLDWGIESYPDWGDWTFTPSSGEDLKPEDGKVTVDVSVIAPDEKNSEFNGNVRIVNKENTSDFCTIDAYLTTPKNKAPNFNFNLLSWLFERFPNAFPILRLLLGS